jgi:glycosyltransferase involved in cell wall biosynthesis
VDAEGERVKTLRDKASSQSPDSRQTPVLSIGMPVYNGERYIRQALDSLLGQTYGDFELIVSDNASTDGTAGVCKETAGRDARVRYIRQNTNIGAAANFGFVLSQARGKLFMWAACDDVWDKNWIAALVRVLDANPDAIAYGTVRTIDEHGRILAHDADGRHFQFKNPRPGLRQLPYYLEYEGLGKANLVYALMPLEVLRAYFSSAMLDRTFGDCVLVFTLLKRVRLLGCSAVSHYKRIHGAGEGTRIGTPDRSQCFTHLARKVLHTLAWAIKAAAAYRAAGKGARWAVYGFAVPKILIFLVRHAESALRRANMRSPLP